MLRAYLPPLIMTVLICGGLTFYIKVLAEKFKILDSPAPRKVHLKPIPRLGGAALTITFLIVILGYNFASSRLNFEGGSFLMLDSRVFGLLLGLLILFIVGVLDDIRSVEAKKKLFWQIVAACVVVGFGVSLSFIRLPFGFHLDLNSWQIPFALFGHQFLISFWADLLSVFWIVLIINTFNFLDGLDGLATGIGFISAGVIFFLSLILGQDANALLAIIIAGLALGFLPWNFYPAKIFLGDSGSMVLGYLIGVLSLISGGKLATAFLVLGIPVLDVGWVILRRLIKGKSPFLADKKHLHHRLLMAGFSQKKAVLLLYLISIIFGCVAIFSKTDEKVTALIVLFVLMMTLALVLVVLELRKRRDIK